MKHIILVGLLFYISSSILHAQTQEEKLNDIFESAYDPSKSGAAILISKGGEILYQNSIGMANVEYQIPISNQTKFHIGSITKQFTAAAILMLKEEGKLNLDDDIRKHLTEFPEKKYPITIAHLLTHTSGIKDYPRIPEIRSQLRNNLSPEQIIELSKDKELEFEPGSKLGYSNTGYILLGLIIEKVSDQAYGTFLKNRIFKVLDMHNSELNNYEAIIKNRAIGYSEDENDQLIHATFHTSPFSSGAIISTVEDMNKWISGLFSYKVISKTSVDKMLSNYTLNNGDTTDIGFGWEINEIAGEPCYEHSGFVPGYKANSVFIPEYDLYVIAVQNNEYGSPTPSMIKSAALAIGKPYPLLGDAKQLSKAEIDNITGTYEIENGGERFISKSEKGFSIKAPGGQSQQLYIKDESTLFYKESYRQITFEKDKNGLIVSFTYKNRNSYNKATKISSALPEERQVQKLDLETLESFVGIYEFEPFDIAITIEEGILYIQPEGSNKLPLLATSLNSFLIKEIGAEITFEMLTNDVLKATLLVEGNVMKGHRKKD